MTDAASRRAVTYARCAALTAPGELVEVAHRLLETLAAECGAPAGALYADEARLLARPASARVEGEARPADPPRLVRIAALGPEHRTPARLPPAALAALDPTEPVTSPGPRVDVALSIEGQPVGVAWLLDVPGASIDEPTRELLSLVGGVGAGALAAARRLEQAEREAVVDRRTKAHGFAFFASVAAHETERARRHGRQFAIAVVSLDDWATLRQRVGVAVARAAGARLVERLRGVLRGSDVLARVEDDELYLLLPETGFVGAFAARARLLAALASERATDDAVVLGAGEAAAPIATPLVTVGVAAFPRDGRDLPSLLRVCRRRAEQSRAGVWRRLRLDGAPALELLDALLARAPDASAEDGATLTGAATDLQDPDGRVRWSVLSADAFAGLAAAVVHDLARRGAPGTIDLFGVVPSHARALASAFEAAAVVPGLSARWVGAPGELPDLETLAALRGHRGLLVATELGHYALVGAATGAEAAPVVHACEPELVDGLARAFRASYPPPGEAR